MEQSRSRLSHCRNGVALMAPVAIGQIYVDLVLELTIEASTFAPDARPGGPIYLRQSRIAFRKALRVLLGACRSLSTFFPDRSRQYA